MLFVGDDWAEDHHDIEVEDADGRRLARARLPEGVAGLARLHELIAEHLTDDDVDPETGFVAPNVVIGIETDRGTWVRRWSRPATRSFRSIRCRWPATGSGMARRGRSPTAATPTCWPRSSGWTGSITGRSPGTPRRSRG